SGGEYRLPGTGGAGGTDRLRPQPPTLQTFSQAGGVDRGPLLDLHDVLVAHELVGVLAYHRESGLGGAGPPLGRAERTRRQRPLAPEGEEGAGAVHGGAQARRKGAGRLGGVGAAGEVD